MFLTFLLFQSNLCVVLAREKCPKISVHGYVRFNFSRQKSLKFKQETPDPQLRLLYRPYMIFILFFPTNVKRAYTNQSVDKFCYSEN